MKSQGGCLENRDEFLLSIVIPAYNEETRLGGSLERIVDYLDTQPFRFEIILADDGSTDGTVEAARRAVPPKTAFRLVELRPNRGKGAAVRAGMLAATGDIMLMSDADLSAPIEELPLLLSALLDEGADLAIGSRGLEESRLGVRQPFLRERMGRVFNLILRGMTGIVFRDTQCGFKLFRQGAARSLFRIQKSDGFAFDAEIVFLAARLGLTVREVPIAWNDSPGSKVHPFLDAVRMFIDLIRFRVYDLRGDYELDPSRKGGRDAWRDDL